MKLISLVEKCSSLLEWGEDVTRVTFWTTFFHHEPWKTFCDQFNYDWTGDSCVPCSWNQLGLAMNRLRDKDECLGDKSSGSALSYSANTRQMQITAGMRYQDTPTDYDALYIVVSDCVHQSLSLRRCQPHYRRPILMYRYVIFQIRLGEWVSESLTSHFWTVVTGQMTQPTVRVKAVESSEGSHCHINHVGPCSIHIVVLYA